MNCSTRGHELERVDDDGCCRCGDHGPARGGALPGTGDDGCGVRSTFMSGGQARSSGLGLSGSANPSNIDALRSNGFKNPVSVS